jgi:hypothetical protein
MPSLPATAHVLEDGRDARCASADGHRLPVPTRRRPPTPQPSAPKGAHEPTLTLRPIDQNRQAGFASGDGYPPTGPFKECSPASRYQAKWRWPISRDRDRSARTGNKLTNWGAPRPRRRTPCDARRHGNRQRHSPYQRLLMCWKTAETRDVHPQTGTGCRSPPADAHRRPSPPPKGRTRADSHTPPDRPKPTSRLREWGWIPTRGPV